MRALLKTEYDAFFEALTERDAVKGLRVNTAKVSADAFLEASDFALLPIPYVNGGFIVSDEEGAGKHPYHHAGAYYMQDPGAMSTVAALPEEIPLGVYECPRPYKRLLTDRMLSFCAQSGRFAFMKDTCCDAAVIARRMKLLEGTPMLLLNANGQTLLDSLRSGAHGYCGVMCNFHPELFVWLCHNFEKDPARADLVQSFLGCAAFLESLAYPVIAKYHLKEIEGLPLECISARTRDERECTEYHRACIRQMDLLAKHINTLI